ncbi:chorismate-binding protein [Campylobacter hominis]|uniref:chorismate-binding protein n=1 Tax=Campylobacter hominis TaxID=76517 RepID=UPI00248BF142|nr:chorismate-binding protein [Campylobacter hominis]
MQTSSEICGILNEHYLQNFGDLFEKILPAGSISGAPKDKTCETIQKNELVKRGFYSGVFVYFDGKILRSFVMIRFVQKNIKK